MDYSGKKVLVMGLGLHGGGLQSAIFMLKRGAILTVTDLRDAKILEPAIEQLELSCAGFGSGKIHYVLGRHDIDDFKKADIVIKNPGVRPDSPFLKEAKKVETDISLFLKESKAHLFAVTGTKGKSSTASALYHIFASAYKNGKSRLGGNITVSPLTFVDELFENDIAVMELSSFQLGDLKGLKREDGSPLLKPKAAVLTAIMEDHLDRYASMEEYIDDKRNIYRGQDENDFTVAYDDEWGKSFLSETRGKPLVCSKSLLKDGVIGGWFIDEGAGFARIYGKPERIVPEKLLTPGKHQKINMLAAALAAYSFGIEAEKICDSLLNFRGIEHRLELFHEENGINFYNDSAATIPQAAVMCIDALSPQKKLVLVTGGTDKNLDFTPLADAAHKASSVILLAGTGSEKLAELLKERNIDYSGPFNDLEKAVNAALLCANKIAPCSIVLSPGCASFGMFLNEFDRGRKWKNTCLNLLKKDEYGY